MAILVLVVSCVLILTTGCLSSQGHTDQQRAAALFVFGDSLFDPGNNNYINTIFQANFTPYGISYFNPPTGRFSDGRLIPDFIAEYARLPLIPAYFGPRKNEFVYGANFASAGAGALVETYAGLVFNLKTQVQRFGDLRKHFRKSLGDVKTKKLLSNAVYLLNCGGNDYLSTVGNNRSLFYMYTREQYVEMVTGNITNVFKRIYKKGGRKIGILNLPPYSCLPSVRAIRPGNTCNKELDMITSLHNRILSKKLKRLEKKLKGFKYALFDFSTPFNNRIKNPSKYGFKVGDSACCGTGPFKGINTCGGKRVGLKKFELCDNINEYLFFDATHPTEAANRQYAELFWNGDSNLTTPYNMKTLFQGK